jgi:hypothetical protein
MDGSLQLPVAIRQQLRVVPLFDTVSFMNTARKQVPKMDPGQQERARFKAALNKRVAEDHPAERGRAVWLYETLRAYRKNTDKSAPEVSSQTCGYWLRGDKIAKHENATLLCNALNMSRDELFGEANGDHRLNDIVEAWARLPEQMKETLHVVALSKKNSAASR